MKKTYCLASPAIIHELLDHEVIVANLDTGTYYSLRESAALIWQHLMAGYDEARLQLFLSEKYAQPAQEIEASVSEFIQSLVEESLIVKQSNPMSVSPTSIDMVWPPIFQAPQLEKYTEMKDLLMLDPIHEVDTEGWPHPAN